MLRAASSIMIHVGPGQCVHTREIIGGGVTTPSAPDPRDVRTWASVHNIHLPAKGKIPASVIERYQASMPQAVANLEYAEEFVLDCPSCELGLRGHELWGPVDEPRPLTRDEKRRLEAEQKAANLNILQGLAALPEMAKLLATLTGPAKD